MNITILTYGPVDDITIVIPDANTTVNAYSR